MSDLPELSFSYILLIAAFVVPGAISVFVYGLIQPGQDRTLKEIYLETIVVSILNFIVLFWPIYYAISPNQILSNPAQTWIILILCLVIAPTIWPILLHYALEKLNRYGLVITGSKTAWDDFFRLHAGKGCWVIARLKTGEKVGGRVSKNSFASSFPREGHIYVQELWDVDAEENLVQERPGPSGIILRPDDYEYVKVIKVEHDYG